MKPKKHDAGYAAAMESLAEADMVPDDDDDEKPEGSSEDPEAVLVELESTIARLRSAIGTS